MSRADGSWDARTHLKSVSEDGTWDAALPFVEAVRLRLIQLGMNPEDPFLNGWPRE